MRFAPPPAGDGGGNAPSIIAALLTGAGLVVTLMAMHVAADLSFMILSVAGLGGLTLHEAISRRRWERSMASRLEETVSGHGQLAREVARNNKDIGILRDGLAETAAALEHQAQLLPAAAASIESRMLGMIAQRLGSLGRKNVMSGANEKPDDTILELELAPPPRKSAPVSKLEEALNPRGKKFSDQVLADMVRQAVTREKIDMYVQPILGLPQRRPRMIEIYGRVRARSGIILPAERYLKSASNDALMPVIDQWLLVHCLQALTDPKALVPGDLPCMLNIDPSMLGNPKFMKALLGFLAQNREMAPRLIFEMAQADLNEISPSIEAVINALAQLGCRFSMDNVRRRRINISRLRQLRIRFLKLDAAWLLREARQDGGQARINRLKKQLDAAGIDLIVERIESEDELRELLDFNINYGQGYLFARPENYAAWRDRHFHLKAA